MQAFESEQEQCAAIIREAVSDYREQEKPVDDELNVLILDNRKKMKEVTDRIMEKYCNRSITTPSNTTQALGKRRWLDYAKTLFFC